MSGERDVPSSADARALMTRAAEWLERRDHAEWNAQEQAALNAWLAESSENLVAYWRVEGAWDRAMRLRAFHIDCGVRATQNTRKIAWPFLRNIVLGLCLLAIIGAGAVYFLLGPHEQVYSTPVGGHRNVALADGSYIDLNTDTVVRADVTKDHRLASIDKGEAYFSISHDAKFPFVVTAGARRITVLGTKFLVRRDAQRLEVALLDGRVWLDEGDRTHNQHALLLTPGDDVVVTSTSLSRVQKTTQEIGNELGWQRGLLVFRYVTLADAVSEFNRYNNEKIIIADPGIARRVIIGTFPTNDIAMFARASRELFGLHVENRGGTIVFSR